MTGFDDPLLTVANDSSRADNPIASVRHFSDIPEDAAVEIAKTRALVFA